MKYLPLLLAPLIFSTSLQARIGDSEEQLQARFGEPKNKDAQDKRFSLCLYHFKNIKIEVAF